MNEESIIGVLTYMMKNNVDQPSQLSGDLTPIISALHHAGFETRVIERAVSWLEDLVAKSQAPSGNPSLSATRVFTDREIFHIGLHCLRLIIDLEQQNALTPHTREIVLQQALALDIDDIEPNTIHWIALMVLSQQPDCSRELALLEFIVLRHTHHRLQ